MRVACNAPARSNCCAGAYRQSQLPSACGPLKELSQGKQNQYLAIGLLAQPAAVLALDTDRMLTPFWQRRVIHDQRDVLAAYQGVSLLAQHLFQRRGGPGRRGYEVVALLGLPGTHAFGHGFDTRT